MPWKLFGTKKKIGITKTNEKKRKQNKRNKKKNLGLAIV